ATAARAIRPNVEIIGVTTRYDAAIYESIRAGRLTMVGERPSIADALPGPIPLDNRYTFRICRDLVDEIVPVADEAIARAMRYAIDHEKIVLEGGGAIGIAYLLENSSRWRGRKMAVVCSGNNVSKERLDSIFEQFELA
ncbi:MAG: pyridoxal-phosphate dependent enzyme, partial [Rhodospirillaceae bacterium]|nr:pyridoxal-phosphate dependent enzyme [Rhodospirillaceae bacterium]